MICACVKRISQRVHELPRAETRGQTTEGDGDRGLCGYDGLVYSSQSERYDAPRVYGCHLFPSLFFWTLQYMRIHPLTDEGKTASKAKLSALRAADDLRRETSQAKNDLESYILKVFLFVICFRRF